jgi:DNA repair exonuclease SbcCD nuclease subunit
LSIRVLLVADTHLGFDHPLRPRVERRRRGPDFFANTRRALAPARAGEVDLVVHGGDLLYRSKVPAELVRLALEPLLEVADAGVPVVLVPGNHERSALPYPMLAAHRHLHVFDRPRSIELRIAGMDIALVGFPCERKEIRDRFPELVAATGWRPCALDLSLLCLHQTVEGATVGPVDYVFRSGADIIRGRDLPTGFSAVLAGHIHRHQVLTRDLGGRKLAAPVFYPGSVERTSTAERDEPKGYLVLEITGDRATGGRLIDWSFHELPARPMIDLEIRAGRTADLAGWLRSRFVAIDPDAVVRVRVTEDPGEAARGALRAASLRDLALPTQTVEVSWQTRR